MGLRVKNTTFGRLLDLVLPYKCRGCGAIGCPLCLRCKKYIISNLCLDNDEIERIIRDRLLSFKPKSIIDQVYSFGFREGILEHAVEDYKYESIFIMKKVLASMILEKFGPLSECVIVPLPTSFRHIRERGFDHVGELADELCSISDASCIRLLIRSTNTTQVGSNRSKRILQMKSTYRVSDELLAELHGRRVILFDDVLTTGASFAAAMHVLQQKGVSNISLLTLCVSR